MSKKQGTIEELDSWITAGLAGLINLIEQRLKLPVKMDEHNFGQLDHEASRLFELVQANTTKQCSTPQKKPGDLEAIDSWIARGLVGLLDIIEGRMGNNLEFQFYYAARLESQLERLKALTRIKSTI